MLWHEIILTITSEAVFIAVSLAITLGLVIRKRPRATLFFTLSFLLTLASVSVLKVLFDVPRPPEPLIPIDGYAFPSGHAAGSMFLSTALFLLLRHSRSVAPWGFFIPFLILPALVSWTRIYFNVHTLPDVLAGTIVGFLVPFVVWYVLLYYKR